MIEGCSCPICKQHRKEWLLNENKTYDLFQNTCEHFWIMDFMFNWYHCVKCTIMRRNDKGIAIQPSMLEPKEWEQSKKLFFKDSHKKSIELNNGNINPKSKGYRNVNLCCIGNTVLCMCETS